MKIHTPITPKGKGAKKQVLKFNKTLVLGKGAEAGNFSDAQFKLLVENMNEAVWMGDEYERTIYANPKFCKLTGYSLDEIKGKVSYGFWAPESAKIVREVNQVDRKKGIASSYEAELITKNGRKIPVLTNGTPLPGGGTIGIITDLTEVKKKEEVLRVSKKLLGEYMQGSPMATFAINRDHKIVYWNKAMEHISGYTAKEMLGTGNHWKPFYEKPCLMITDYMIEGIDTPEIINKHYGHMDVEECASKKGVIGSVLFTNTRGEKKWLRFMIKPLRDPHNKIIGAIETVEDITEKKLTETKLKRRMNELWVMYQVTSHTKMVHPMKQVLRDIAKDIASACRFPGIALAHIVFDGKCYSSGKSNKSFVHKIEFPINIRNVRRGYIQMGYTKTIEEMGPVPILDEEQKLLSVVTEIICKHIQSREVVNRYKKLINKSVAGIYILQNGIFRYANPKLCKILKIKEDEIIGMSFSRFVKNCDCYKKLLKSPKISSLRCENKAIHSTGEEIDVEIISQKIDYHGKMGIIGTMHDITRVKRAEERMRNFNKELKEKIAEKTLHLKQANKRLRSLNELKDEFIAVTSHELRSPLTAVRGYLSFLVEKKILGSLPDNLQQYIMRAYNNVEVLNSLVNNILDVSRLETGRFELQKVPVEMISFLQNIIDNYVHQAQENKLKIHLENNTDEKTIFANIDLIRIRQVMRNILDNAIKFSGTGKGIWIGIEKDRGLLRIKIKDQGIGIPKEQIQAIFDKFIQVLNPQTQYKGGAGLGLYISKKIVELHKGRISVESEANKGSIFTIELPFK